MVLATGSSCFSELIYQEVLQDLNKMVAFTCRMFIRMIKVKSEGGIPVSTKVRLFVTLVLKLCL